MRRTTMTKLTWFAIGVLVVLMNVGNFGITLANLFGKNIQYGD